MLNPSPRPDARQLIIDIDGFEGPLDLLLHLARRQKVDLTKISVLALAEQYLAFIARAEHLQQASEYLVTAAWLAYLKSRLLLPDTRGDEERMSAEEEAGYLSWRLAKLEAMRTAAASLMGRMRLGRDVFAHGQAEGLKIAFKPLWRAGLHDLLYAYAATRRRASEASALKVRHPPVFSLERARLWLESLFGPSAGNKWGNKWEAFEHLLPAASPDRARSARASTFSAALFMARDGKISLKQDALFGALWLRRKTGEKTGKKIGKKAKAVEEAA